MSDLTKRLRNKANTLCDEAANEIEALKAENVSVQFELDNMTTVAGDIQDLLDVSANENKALKAERDRLRETVEPLVVYIRKWKNDDIPCDLTAACEELINHKEG